MNTLPVLAYKEGEKKVKKWNILYAYNIRTIRDIFIYCCYKEKITKSELYDAMDKNIIPPPKDRWTNPKRKRKDRTKLEYLHTARYLGFIKLEGKFLVPDFSKNSEEKKIILEENKLRVFEPMKVSSPFTKKERKAITKIILNYERVRDFLRWFLDFNKYQDIWSFDEKKFKSDALPLYVSKIEKGEKGPKIIKREVDDKFYKIPPEYQRIISFVFPNWLRELGLMDIVVVFQEFSFDNNLWYMYYPIKMTDEEFLCLDLSKVLISLFLKNASEKTIWIPYLIFMIAKKYYCSTTAIKLALEKLYEKDPTHFYLERAPLHLMRRKTMYRDSYVEVDGFFRSHIKIIK